MTCSVIIVHYNTFEYTRHCIQSLNNSTIVPQIIIVNNSDKDRDIDELKDFFANIEIVGNGKNIGFSKAVNIGLGKATGKYICLLNSDCTVQPTTLSTVVAELENDASIGAITPKIVTDGLPVFAAQAEESLKDVMLVLVGRRSRFTTKQGLYWSNIQNDQLFDAEWIWGTCFCFPKEILNYFPERKLHDDFFLYVEDFQWSTYIRKKLGMRITYLPSAAIFHSSGKSSNINEAQKFKKYIYPNHFRLLKKNYSIIYARLFYLLKSIQVIKSDKNFKLSVYFLKLAFT